jgi:ParB family chromosome partitioning protein
MTTMTTETTTKKAFDLSRNSIYVASPDELSVIGGQALPMAERGPLDTKHVKGEHDLWDERIHDEITEESVANIDYYGVMEPIIIAKDPETGHPVVVDGRGRVRRARRANLLRAKRGEPAIKIDCKVIRSVGTRLMGAMIALNEVRTDDSPLVKLEKAKRLMERGVSEEDAAMTFGMDADYFRLLLTYDDNATPEVKAAVAGGELSATAAVEMVRAAKTPEAQAKALATVKANKKAGKPATVRAATEAAKRATGRVTGEHDAGLIPSRRELARVLKSTAMYTAGVADEARILIDDDKGKSGLDVEQRHVVDAFYVGVQTALELVFGKCKDVDVLKMLSDARKELAK